jgi:hypothetical protein
MALSDFMKSVSKLGTLSDKKIPPKAGKDPVESFCKKALEQIEIIETGVVPEETSLWFKKQDDGSYLVYLKNGIRYLPMKGTSNEFHAKDAKSAVAYLNKAAEAAADGDFDELFAATKPVGGGKKKVSDDDMIGTGNAGN